MTPALHDEILLGFDARVPPADAARGWTAERRARFLVRTDATTPLSIDPAVWPVAPGALPRVGPWRLVATLSDLGGATEGAVTIAVAFVAEARAGDDAWRERFDGARGPIPPGFVPLGFDVVDLGGISVLTNTSIEETPPPPPEVVEALDRDTHLFSDLAAARRFRDDVERRLPTHAPLGVVRLHRRDR